MGEARLMPSEYSKLEDALVRAGRGITYPPTPPLAARVARELQGITPAQPESRRGWLLPRVLLPLGAAVLLALALLFALPSAREAVAQLLGLRGLRIFYVTPTPLPPPTATGAPGTTPRPTPTRTPTGQPNTLCCEMTLAQAAARARMRLLIPPGETPSKVYYQPIFGDGRQVVMVFGDPAAPRFTLYQADRWVYGKILANPDMAKGVGAQTQLAETVVRGERALWFSGAPHILLRLDARGQPDYETAQPVNANTLAWEVGDMDRGTVYRLETELPLEEAIKFAESLIEYSNATVTPTRGTGN